LKPDLELFQERIRWAKKVLPEWRVFESFSHFSRVSIHQGIRPADVYFSIRIDLRLTEKGRVVSNERWTPFETYTRHTIAVLASLIVNACLRGDDGDLVSGRTIFNLLIAPNKSTARKAESKTSTRHSREHHAARSEHAPCTSLHALHSTLPARHCTLPARSLHGTARHCTSLHGPFTSLHGTARHCTVLARHCTVLARHCTVLARHRTVLPVLLYTTIYAILIILCSTEYWRQM